MAGIQIGETASIMTEQTSIFNGDQEQRYVVLRGVRKEISAYVNSFLAKRKLLLSKTPEEKAADFEIDAEMGDNDHARVCIALNAVEWIETAQGSLDPHNQYDNGMLTRIADYVEKVALIMGAEPYFTPLSEADAARARFPTRDQIVLVRLHALTEKRERLEESNDESFAPPTAIRAFPPQDNALTSDSSTENIAEQVVNPSSRQGRGVNRKLSFRGRRAPASGGVPLIPAGIVAQPIAPPTQNSQQVPASPRNAVAPPAFHVPVSPINIVAPPTPQGLLAPINIAPPALQVHASDEVAVYNAVRVQQSLTKAKKEDLKKQMEAVNKEEEQVAMDMTTAMDAVLSMPANTVKVQQTKDAANQRQAVRSRKISKIIDVVDLQRDNGILTHAQHDQVQQIIQDQLPAPSERTTSASSGYDAHQETLIDLEGDGYKRVCHKKKSPKKPHERTVDSPRFPPIPSRDADVQGEDELHRRIEEHQERQKEVAQKCSLQQQLLEAQLHVMSLQRQQQDKQQFGKSEEVLSATDNLRQRKLAASHAKDSRPTKKFNGGNPFEYKNVICRYEQAVNSTGMDERMKILELAHWFSGNAAEVIDSFSAHEDAAFAYAAVRSQLDSLYGQTWHSVLPLVRQIANGKPIAEYDLEGHVTLLTKMITAESTASQVGQLDQLDRRDNIGDIAEKRVKHIGKQVWQKDEDLKESEGRTVNWADLKRLIQRQINILITRSSVVTPTTSAPPVKVAAATTTPNDRPGRGRTTNSARGQPDKASGSCRFCSSPHAIEVCPVLLKMTPDERVVNFKKRGICFGCLEQGHMKNACPYGKPKCQTCKMPGHHAMLHGRTPLPASHLSVHAAQFLPGGANSTIPPTASTTSSEVIMQPILPSSSST